LTNASRNSKIKLKMSKNIKIEEIFIPESKYIEHLLVTKNFSKK